MYQTAREETYQDGQVIFEEGNYGDWVYVIESGAVEISKKIGQNKVVIEVLKPGGVFGELGFIASIPRTATAQAIGTTIVGVIDNNSLLQEFNKLSGNFRTILTSMVVRLHKTTETAAQLKLRRQGPRVPKVLSLTYRSRDELIKAYTENASKGGFFIKTTKPLPKEERFFLKLQLPGAKDPIKIGCMVSWSHTATNDPLNPPGMGVEFIQISDADQQKINKELMKVDSK